MVAGRGIAQLITSGQIITVHNGLCAATGGILWNLYSLSGFPRAGIGMELDAIAAVVVGGALLTGGYGYVIGSVVGVLILGLVQTFIEFDGTLSSWWTRIFIGTLLLVFILLQRLFSRKGLTLLGRAIGKRPGPDAARARGSRSAQAGE